VTGDTATPHRTGLSGDFALSTCDATKAPYDYTHTHTHTQMHYQYLVYSAHMPEEVQFPLNYSLANI